MMKIIFGAGQIGKIALRYCGYADVYCFADNNKDLQGTEIWGKPVISFAELKAVHKEYDVLVAMAYCSAICLDLKEAGIPYDVFHIEYAHNVDLKSVEEGLLSSKLPNELCNLVSESENEDFVADGMLIKKYMKRYSDLWRFFIYNNAGVWYACESIYHGHKNSLRAYCGLPETDWFDIGGTAIFHGEAFGKGDCTFKPANYTCFSDNMRDEIRLSLPRVPILPIGSYIRYAEPYYDKEQTAAYRKQIGRNLLVFPGHSIYKSNVWFDEDEFAKFVAAEAKKFDTVTAVIYFADIEGPFVDKFIELGGRIACAGLKTDKHFLSRLRTLIESADVVLTNNIGTHVPYALALGKPVKFFEQKYSRELQEEFGAQPEDKTIRELKSVLMNDEYVITPEILDVYEPYLGIKYFRAPEELRAYFEVCEEILCAADYKTKEIVNAAQSVLSKYKNSSGRLSALKYKLLSEAIEV